MSREKSAPRYVNAMRPGSIIIIIVKVIPDLGPSELCKKKKKKRCLIFFFFFFFFLVTPYNKVKLVKLVKQKLYKITAFVYT